MTAARVDWRRAGTVPHLGATARDMLLTAAAQKWKADKARLDTRDGVVIEIGGQNDAPTMARSPKPRCNSAAERSASKQHADWN